MRTTTTEAAMVGNPIPTVRMRMLAMELRRAREAAGKKTQEAADYLGISAEFFSRFESGTRTVRPLYVRNLCQLYGLSAEHTMFLEKTAEEALERGWWTDYDNNVPRWFERYVDMETVASTVGFYASILMPGLLQSPRYMEIVTASVEARQLRQARQERLTSETDPLVVRAILDESVLYRIVGDTRVMHEQITHLRTMIDLPNVDIRVLPFWSYSRVMTSFTALRFPESAIDTIFINLTDGALYLEKPGDVAVYTEMFERLTDMALDAKGTESFLSTIEEERYSV